MKVLIKTREEMEEELELDSDGDIYIEADKDSFTRRMEDEMPEDRIIEVEPQDTYYSWVDLDLNYNITENMIKQIIEGE